MKKTYTKIILGLVTFLWMLLGPISVIIKPAQLHADIAPSETKLEVSFQANIAHAEAIKANEELAITLESFVKVIYVLLWPALFIAGLAMDNSLIYGEIFGIDKALFQFWQIMKNFANFTLGFIFVWSILKYIFDLKSGANVGDVKKMVGKLLLGSVLVNTSWFILGVLVDLSTALTVGIGGLPLQLLGDTELAKKPLLGTVATINMNDAIGKRGSTPIFHTWPGATWGGKEKYLLLCNIENGKIIWDPQKRQTTFKISNVAGEPLPTSTNQSTTPTTTQTDTMANNGTRIGRDEVVKDFCVSSSHAINKGAYEAKGSPIVYDTALMKEVYQNSVTALEAKTKCTNNKACQTIGSFASKLEGYQGAFYSLYASLMDLGSIHIGVPKTETSLSMEALIKIIIAIAYLIPLVILAIVLVMRVGYLWLIIAFSPFIALAITDIGGISKKAGGMDGIGKVFNKDNVISLLMMPVIVTFVISLSIVFLGSISQGLTTNADGSALGIYQRMEGTSYKCYDLALTNVCFDIPTKDVGLGISDYFSWTLINMFGIALMWFAVMAALKSNKITGGVAGSISSLAQNAVMSANFIPIPGGDGKSTSLAGLASIPKTMSRLANDAKYKSDEQTSEALLGLVNDATGKDKKANEAISITTKAIQQAPKDFAKQKEVFQSNLASTSNFAAPAGMNFGNVDGSLGFANYLASKTPGLKNNTFSNGQELFTKPEGQQTLAKWMAGASPEAWANLKAMYSGVSGDERKWNDIEKEIKAMIAPTTPVKVLGDTKSFPLYFANNKISIGDASNTTPSEDDVKRAVEEINTKLQQQPKPDISDIMGKEIMIGDARIKLQQDVTNPQRIAYLYENKTAPVNTGNNTTQQNTASNTGGGTPPATTQKNQTPGATPGKPSNTQNKGATKPPAGGNTTASAKTQGNTTPGNSSKPGTQKPNNGGQNPAGNTSSPNPPTK